MFYISSQGHSGTGWLAKSLNKHPEIVCWHGTRSIPPYDAGDIGPDGMPVKILSPNEFIHGLLECENKTFGNKIFGSIHGYYGVECKDIIESRGGKFFAVFRHPILKINSIFSAYYVSLASGNKINSDEIKLDYISLFSKLSKNIDYIYEKKNNIKENKILLKKILKYFHLLSITKFLVKKIKTLFRSRVKITNDENYLFDINNFSDEFLSQKAIETFEHSCIRTFETDHEIIQNCKYDQFLKMEEFVSSKEYFKECFIKITGKNLSNEILDVIFEDQNHINTHSKVKNINEIYKSWPKSFKKVYKKYIYDLKLESKYEQLGYNLLLNE